MTTSEEDLLRARNRLAAGRIRTTEMMPYFSKALLAVAPIERQALGKFAMDSEWRLYYDPELCLTWSVDEIAGAWIHQTMHVFRQHQQRYQMLPQDKRGSEVWSVLTDASINSDLIDDEVSLPSTPEFAVTRHNNPVTSDWNQEDTPEGQYRTYFGNRYSGDSDSGEGKSKDSEERVDSQSEAEKKEKQEQSPSKKESKSSEKEKDSSDERSESSEEASTNDDSGGTEKPQEDTTEQDDSPSKRGETGKDAQPIDKEVEGPATKAGGEEEEPGQEGGDPNDSPPMGSGTSPTGAGEPTEGTESQPSPHEPHEHTQAACGSSVDGVPREYEAKYGEDGYEPGVDRVRAEMLLEEVARDIIKSANEKPGDMPGHLLRRAKGILNPQADWKVLWKVFSRREVANIVGRYDYTYARPSRRNVGSSFILPSLKKGREPYFAVVIDTSASMKQNDLDTTLSELAALLKRVQGKTSIITCDAESGDVSFVKNIRDVKLIGGGGTDMRKGIATAIETKPRPDVVAVITDGGTQWSKEIPKEAPRAKYVVLLVLPKSVRPDVKAGLLARIPKWMTVIEVNS